MKTKLLFASAVVVVTVPLAGSQCEGGSAKEAGDGVMQSARESLDEAVDDTGGWAGRTVDHTEGRLKNSVGKGMDRINSVPDE